MEQQKPRWFDSIMATIIGLAILEICVLIVFCVNSGDIVDEAIKMGNINSNSRVCVLKKDKTLENETT